jgi:hypothetical protein
MKQRPAAATRPVCMLVGVEGRERLAQETIRAQIEIEWCGTQSGVGRGVCTGHGAA